MFLIFKYNLYYPEGGFHDLIEKSDNMEAAIKIASDAVVDDGWGNIAHVVDADTFKIIYECSITDRNSSDLAVRVGG